MALAAMREHGVALLFTGAIVTLVPLIVALGFGRLVLRLHPVILLGALCGGQTVAAALNAVNEASESVTPVLGFTMTYAVSCAPCRVGPDHRHFHLRTKLSQNQCDFLRSKRKTNWRKRL